MKFLPIASLALVLALSGCSSSPSIEEQTKLVEYEKCLEQVTERLYSINYTTDSGYGFNYTYSDNAFAENTFELTLQECEIYRP